MLMAEYYELKPLRALTTNFVRFRNAHVKWKEMIDADDTGEEFINLIQLNKGEDEDVIKQQINDFRERGKHDNIMEICEKSEITRTEYGKEIGELLKELLNQDEWGGIWHQYRTLDVQLLRHLKEFFKCKNVEKGSTMKQRLKLWDFLYNLSPDESISNFYNLVEKICELKYPLLKEKNVESKRDLGNRCFREFQGIQTIAWVSDTKALADQLDLIQWKDYVPATITRREKTQEAIEYLQQFRDGRRYIIQVFGHGGLGKTKLILEFLRRCITQDSGVEPFDSYLVLTAKSVDQGEFSSEITEIRTGKLLNNPRDPTLAIGHYVYNLEYKDTMEYMYSLAGLTELDRTEDELFDCFKSNKFLIILDNFEDTNKESQKKYLDFFDRFEKIDGGRTKIIVTGRSDIDHDEVFQRIRLNPLTNDQATELLQRRYEYQFQQFYGGAIEGKTIYADFRTELNNPDLLKLLHDRIEKRENGNFADNYETGIHHPAVIFYFVSIIMDKKIVDEFREEYDSEPTFMDIFEYTVCHPDYGVGEFVNMWEDWIQDKTMLVIKNDTVCMDILKFMAQNPNKFYRARNIKLENNIERTEINHAFEKMKSQANILEEHLEVGGYRMTSWALENFGDDGNTNDDESLRYKLQKLNKNMRSEPEKTVKEFCELISKMNGKVLSLHSEFSALAYFIGEIEKTGNYPRYYQIAAESFYRLFDNIVNLKIPEEGWSRDKMRDYITDFGGESPPANTIKPDLLKHVENIRKRVERDDHALLTNKTSKWYQGEICTYLLSTLSVANTSEKFWEMLNKYPYNKFISAMDQECPGNVITTIREHCEKLLMDDDCLSKKELNLFLPLIPVFRAEINKNSSLIKWYFSQLTNGKIDVKKFLDTNKQEWSPSSYVNFKENIKSILENKSSRMQIPVNKNSIQLYDFFDSMRVIEDDGPGVLDKLALELPFCEFIPDSNAPHHYKSEEGHDIDYYNADGEETLEDSELEWQNKRFILKDYIPAIVLLEFIIVDRKTKELVVSPTLSGDSRPKREKGDELIPLKRIVSPEVEPETKTNKLTKIIDGLSGNREYFEAIISMMKMSREEISEDILQNAIDQSKDDWRITFSGIRTDYVVAIERITHKTISSSQDSDNKLENQYIKWFERKPRGMIYKIDSAHDILKKLTPKLLKFYSNEEHKFDSPAAFATQFLKNAGSQPDHRIRTMYFGAAHGAWIMRNCNDMCDVIDAYEMDLMIWLKKEKFQRTKKNEYASRNEVWLKKMRTKCNCSEESLQERRDREQEEDNARWRAEKKELEAKKKEAAARKKAEKEIKHKEEVRKNNEKFINKLLEKPDNSTTNFDEFKHAVTNLRNNLEYSTSKTRSAVFASCYRNKYKSVHAKLSISPKYTSILQYLFDYHEKKSGVKRITVDELIILAFKKIHFEEDQIAGLL
jgi:hypothetical protein